MILRFFSIYRNILPEIILCLVGLHFFSVYYTRQKLLTPDYSADCGLGISAGAGAALSARSEEVGNKAETAAVVIRSGRYDFSGRRYDDLAGLEQELLKLKNSGGISQVNIIVKDITADSALLKQLMAVLVKNNISFEVNPVTGKEGK